VDRHPVDADPDPNQNFHYDADPDLDPDRHQKTKTMRIQIRIVPKVLTHVGKWGKIYNFYTFIHSNANLLCFFFLISEKGVMILSILDSMLKCSRKKSKIHALAAWNLYRSGSVKMMRIRPDQDTVLYVICSS
jgi:hypothetical protein